MSYAFSVGRSKRPDLGASSNKFVPGPGGYSAKFGATKNSDPSWGFGTSKRPAQEAPTSAKGIGPGAYAIPQKAVEGSRYSMGAICGGSKYGTLSPGPGAYEPGMMKTQNFKYSMAAKLEKGGIIESPKSKSPSPGPGGYDPKKMFHSDGFTRFGTSKRPGIYNERNAKAFPSPDNYQQDASKIMRRSAQYSFGGQSQRARLTGTLAPGPGAYDIK